MKNKQFTDTLIQTLLKNTEFLHNNFEVRDGELYWRERMLTGKNLGAVAGRKASDVVRLRGFRIPATDIIKALSF